MTALILSRVLMAGILVLVAGAAASLYGFSWVLDKEVKATDHVKIDAELSRANVSRLKKLESELTSKQDVVIRAQNIVAQSSSYQYQDQIVSDINAHAARSGVSVLGYDFKLSGAQQSKPGAQKTRGLKTIAATVTLNGPMEFEKLLKFLKAIEQNLTKMQVTGIGISKDDQSPTLVNNPSVGLEIYVK